MLAQYVGKSHKTWDENIAVLQYAFNTARHEATGYSPAYLNHGRELTRPHPEDRQPATRHSTPDTTHRRLQDAYALVRVHLARAAQRQEKYYNLRRRDWRPKIGERVWKKDHTLSDKSKAFNAKLAPKFIGPLEVDKIISPVVVDLRDSRGRWHRHIHVRDLKPHVENDASHSAT